MDRIDVLILLAGIGIVITLVTLIVLNVHRDTGSEARGGVQAFTLDKLRKDADNSEVMELWAFGVDQDQAFVVSVRRDAKGNFTMNRPTNRWRKGAASDAVQCAANTSQLSSYELTTTVVRVETDEFVEFKAHDETVLLIRADGNASVRPAPGASLVDMTLFGTEYTFSFGDGVTTNGKYVHAMGTIGDSGWGGIEFHKSSAEWSSLPPFKDNWYSDWFMFYNTETNAYGFATIPTAEGRSKVGGSLTKGSPALGKPCRQYRSRKMTAESWPQG